jgi:hypothetical protein
MSPWLIAIILYALLALGTAMPVLRSLLKKIELHAGGPSFKESLHLSDKAKELLSQNFDRIYGTLLFWKKQAEIYKRFHYYTIWWTIPSAVIIPFLAQAITPDPYSKWLITLVSSHTAILLSLHKALKVERNFKAFRQGESEYYDLYRRLLDRPTAFGETEEDQLNNYFDAVENVRKYVRNAETDNFPAIEQVKTQLSNEVTTPRGQTNKDAA